MYMKVKVFKELHILKMVQEICVTLSSLWRELFWCLYRVLKYWFLFYF